jgi:Transglycosylase SLT domain
VTAPAAALGVLAFAIVAVIAAVGGARTGAAGLEPLPGQAQASALASHDIPPAYLRLYQLAARRYGLDWAILAAIGKVECDHGRDPDPSCGRPGSVNSAGAGGPMQFLASTWALYGVDGDGDGRVDRWNPADAVFSAANYLRAAGAPEHYTAAIFAYDHARWYVTAVQRWARRYRGDEAESAPSVAGSREMAVEGGDTATLGASPTPVELIAGDRAVLASEDAHLALVPAEAPLAVRAMVVAGNELQDLPYGPGGHPDPRGASQEDCSSTVNYVLYRSGARAIGEILRDNPLAQDYLHWGAPGRGRWVTIYATTKPTPHVFMVIAGLRLDTSHDGTDVGPNRLQDGPRWRVLDHIPTWAHWSVRHPPGL